MKEDPKPGQPASEKEPLPEPRFEAESAEEAVREYWKTLGDFRGKKGEGAGPCTVLLEPFDCTGPIHMGGALGAVLADSFARRRRMEGMDVRLVAGFHHAGLARKRRPGTASEEEEASSREEAVEEEIRGVREGVLTDVADQFRRLGISCDPGAFYFTMDESTTLAGREAFYKLFNQGLIYREKKLVMWCPSCKVFLSENETDGEIEVGAYYYVRYPIKGEVEKYLTVGTSEPETIPGDVALLVHGEDERYRENQEWKVLNPITQDEIPVLCDDRVDPRLGTGVVRLTPGREERDFERALAMGVESDGLFDAEGKIGGAGGPLEGMEVKDARESALAALEKGELLERQVEEDLEKTVCAHCRGRVRPLVSEQWFLRMGPLLEPVVEAVKAGEVTFLPERWGKTFLSWAETEAPWCISRQNFRGQKIEAYFCRKCGTPHMGMRPAKGCRICGHGEFREEEEVLDPWFSAVLAPLAAVGWPRAGEAKRRLPAEILYTTRSSFLSWTARLLALGTALAGTVPFRHAVVLGRVAGEAPGDASPEARDAIDPRDILSRSGTDALRLGLAELPFDSQDIHLDHDRFDAGRNFVNKFWNVCRFASRFLVLSGETDEPGVTPPEDIWIQARLDDLVTAVTRALIDHDPARAAEEAVEFVRAEVSAWYIEMVKTRLKTKCQVDSARKTLGRIVFTLLRLLHPLIPFVTETVWRRFLSHIGSKAGNRNTPLDRAPWPKSAHRKIDPGLERGILLLRSVVSAVRSIRTKYRISMATGVSLHVSFSDREDREFLEPLDDLLKNLVNASELHPGVHLTKPVSCATEVHGAFQVFIPLLGTKEGDREVERLKERKARLEDRLIKTSRPLESWEFNRKAPKEVRDKLRKRREILSAQIQHIEENIRDLRACEKIRLVRCSAEE